MKAIANGPPPSTRPSEDKSSAEILTDWNALSDPKPPLAFAECEVIAAIGEVGAKTPKLEASVFAAKLLSAYAGTTARWKDETRDAYTDAVSQLFQEHHPRAVLAVVEGPNRIRKVSKFAPAEAELEAALIEAESLEKSARARARLAVALYAAQAIPGLLDSSKMMLYRRTGDGDRAIELVWEVQGDAS